MIYSLKFLVLQCIVWTLNVTRFLLIKSFFFSFDEIETSKNDMEFIYMFEVGKRTIIVLPNNFMYF